MQHKSNGARYALNAAHAMVHYGGVLFVLYY
jgi:hypothetical protein